jgi:hypothetical protein
MSSVPCIMNRILSDLRGVISDLPHPWIMKSDFVRLSRKSPKKGCATWIAYHKAGAGPTPACLAPLLDP